MAEIFRLDDYRTAVRDLAQHERAIADVDALAAARQREQIKAMFAAWGKRIAENEPR